MCITKLKVQYLNRMSYAVTRLMMANIVAVLVACGGGGGSNGGGSTSAIMSSQSDSGGNSSGGNSSGGNSSGGNSSGGSASTTGSSQGTNNQPIGNLVDSNSLANTVLESSPPGTLIELVAHAPDADTADSVTYAITSDPSNLFSIVKDTGQVLLARKGLDFELQTQYTITIQATSTDGSSASADFTITVQDVTSTLTVVFPPPNTVVSSETINFRGTFTEAPAMTSISININGQSIAANVDNDNKTWTIDNVPVIREKANDPTVSYELVGKPVNGEAVTLSHTLQNKLLIGDMGPMVIDPVSSNLVMFDSATGAFVSIDHLTKNHSLFLEDSSPGAEKLSNVTDMIISTKQKKMFVTDYGRDALLSIDLNTGKRSIVSNVDIGQGKAFSYPMSLVATDDSGNEILVVDALLKALIQVDVTTGNRTVISDSSVGTGEIFSGPCAVELDPTKANHALVVDSSNNSLFRVNLANGDRTVVSAAGPGDLEFSDASQFAVINETAFIKSENSHGGGDSVVAVNLHTGVRLRLSDPLVANGPSFKDIGGIIGSPSGSTLLVTDISSDELFRINLDSQERSIVDSNSAGLGDRMNIDPSGGGITLREMHGDLVYLVDDADLYRINLASSERKFMLSTFDPDAVPHRFPFLTADIAYSSSLDSIYLPSTTSVYSVDLSASKFVYVSANNFDVGQGPKFSSPHGISFDDENQQLYVANIPTDALMRVNPLNGDREIVSQGNEDSLQLDYSHELVVDVDRNRVITSNGRTRGLIAIDLSTGKRSTFGTQNTDGGEGPDIGYAIGVTIDKDNDLLIASMPSKGSGGLIAMNLQTGQRRMISGSANGKGQSLSAPGNLAYDKQNQLVYVVDIIFDAVFVVDTITGDRAILAK